MNTTLEAYYNVVIMTPTIILRNMESLTTSSIKSVKMNFFGSNSMRMNPNPYEHGVLMIHNIHLKMKTTANFFHMVTIMEIM